MTLPAQGDDDRTVVVDHAQCTSDASAASASCAVQRTVRVHAGEVIRVFIEHTYPDQFDYTIAGVEKPAPGVTAHAAGQAVTYTLVQVHDPKYGGYVVHVTPKQNVQNAPLGALTITITAQTREWQQRFAGAFAFSSLTDPPYAVRDSVVAVPATATTAASSRTVSRFVELADRRSPESHGPAAFVHVLHTDYDWIGGTFGVGLQTSAPPSYYAGLSLFAGDKAAITVGAVAGSIKAPPAGIKLGDSVASANVLTNLPTRTAVGAFIAFSFNFLGNAKDALSKPFLDAPTAAPSGTPTPPAGVDHPATPDLTTATLTVGPPPQPGKVGDAITLSAKVLTKDGHGIPNTAVRWSADDDRVAGVREISNTDDQGVASTTVTLKAPGTTNVNAKAQIGTLNANGVPMVSKSVRVVVCDPSNTACLAPTPPI